MRTLLVVLALSCVMATPVFAEDPPWAAGVSADRKARAKKLLDEGNELFLKNKHVDALARYQAALAVWDHPAIRFNIVRTLIALDRVLEANEHLIAALRYGSQPLEEQVYVEALNYQRLLQKRLGVLELRCEQSGVALKVDTTTIACPATRQITTEPGPHVVVATGDGYQPASHDVLVFPEKTASLTITLDRVGEVPMEERRRWAAWKPWVVLGAGGTTLLAGVLLDRSARSDRDALDRSVSLTCASRCSDAQYAQLGFARQESRIRTLSTSSLVTLGVGGAVVTTGVVLVLMNRPTLRPRLTPHVELGAGAITLGLAGEL